MFNEQVTALFWALPAVLLVGAGAILLLKRFMPGWMKQEPAPTMRQLAEPLTLSEHTTIYCIEVRGRTFVVAESSRPVHIEADTFPVTGNTRSRRAPWINR